MQPRSKNHLNIPFNPALLKRAAQLRKSGNLSEALLWNQLKRKQLLGLDFDRQKVIGNYIVDFFCPMVNAVIEIDGESHNFKGDYDIERENYLKGLGLVTFHFADIDIKTKLATVVEHLKTEFEKLLRSQEGVALS